MARAAYVRITPEMEGAPLSVPVKLKIKCLP